MLKSVSLFLSQTLRAHRESTLFFLSIHNKHFKTINSFRVHNFFSHLGLHLPHCHYFQNEISLNNNTTLSQSELIRMFFISYDTCTHYFSSLRAKISHLTALFIAVVLKRIWLGILCMTNKIH